MAFFERAHAVFCRNLKRRSTEPVLNGLIGRIARDEERHEEFFANLVAHCLGYSRDETIEAIARRAAELEVVGADIDAYQDKVRNVAEAGIFDDATAAPGDLRPHHRVGPGRRARTAPFVTPESLRALATARLHGAHADSRSSVVFDG